MTSKWLQAGKSSVCIFFGCDVNGVICYYICGINGDINICLNNRMHFLSKHNRYILRKFSKAPDCIAKEHKTTRVSFNDIHSKRVLGTETNTTRILTSHQNMAGKIFCLTKYAFLCRSPEFLCLSGAKVAHHRSFLRHYKQHSSKEEKQLRFLQWWKEFLI